MLAVDTKLPDNYHDLLYRFKGWTSNERPKYLGDLELQQELRNELSRRGYRKALDHPSIYVLGEPTDRGEDLIETLEMQDTPEGINDVISSFLSADIPSCALKRGVSPERFVREFEERIPPSKLLSLAHSPYWGPDITGERYEKILRTNADVQRLFLRAYGDLRGLREVALSEPSPLFDEMLFSMSPATLSGPPRERGFLVPHFVDPFTYLLEYARSLKRALEDSERTDEEMIWEDGIGLPMFYGRKQLIDEMRYYRCNPTFLFPHGDIRYGRIDKETERYDIATLLRGNYPIDINNGDRLRLQGILDKVIEEYPYMGIPIASIKNDIAFDYVNYSIDPPPLIDGEILLRLFLLGRYIHRGEIEMANGSKERMPPLPSNISSSRLIYYDPESNGYLYSIDSIGSAIERPLGRDIGMTLMLSASVWSRHLSGGGKEWHITPMSWKHNAKVLKRNCVR